MQEELKTVKDIFSDFENESTILESKIAKVNLFKKTNKIQIDLKGK